MAKIESIRQFSHPLSVTEGEDTPVRVTLRRMTVDEWQGCESKIIEIQSQAVIETLREQLLDLKDGDGLSADALEATVNDAATIALRQLVEKDRFFIDKLRDCWIRVDGLEGVETGEEQSTLLDIRPVVLELWGKLRDKSSLSEDEKKH